MTGRRYVVLDVFTRTPLAGNPLAVVLDAEGLSTERMQAIAHEFHLSETTFVLPPQDARHRAAVRIFTPHHELPFAGHPTVGTALALAQDAATDAILVLEETVGPVRCVVSRVEGAGFAEFDLPQLPAPIPLEAPAAAVGEAVGLFGAEVGFDNHAVSAFSAGVPYVCIPVRDLEVLGRARLDLAAWRRVSPDKGVPDAVASAYLYTRDPEQPDGGFRVRMFVPASQPYEDPATGSAAAAFGGVVMRFEKPGAGIQRLSIRQGVEMGRPSQIRLELVVGPGGELKGGRIGGFAVKVAEGILYA